MEVEKILKTKHNLTKEKRVLLNLQMTGTAIGSRISLALKPFGISTQQFNVLRILCEQNGEALNQNEIQSRMVHTMSNTTRLVDKLIKRSLVKRKECKENRRKVEIKITRKGEELLSKIDPVMQDTEQNIVRQLSDEKLTNLNDLLNELATGSRN